MTPTAHTVPETAPGAPPRPAPAPAPHSARPALLHGRPTRVAIVGAGYIADYHLQILRSTRAVEVVALCDPATDSALGAAERHGLQLAVGSVGELADLEIDVAHVLVPPDQHVPVAFELLELGISVLLEKPMATSASEARALARLAAERWLVLAVNHNATFHPTYRRLLATVRAGAIGKVERVQATLGMPLRQLEARDYSHWMFRAPRNIVFEQATHPFSQLYELVGRVESLDATLLSTRELQPGRIFHDGWSLAARAAGGTAEVSLAFGTGFPCSRLRVIGSDGVVEADLHHELLTLERKTQYLDFWNSFLAGWRNGRRLLTGTCGNLLRYLRRTLGLGTRDDPFYVSMRDSIRAFHTAFRQGERPPGDARSAIAVLEWCDAAVARLPAPAPRAELRLAPTPARSGEVCVLGASGFIGRQTIAALAELGLPTTAVVRRLHELPTEITQGHASGALRVVRANLSDAEALSAAVRGARVVLHLATGNGNTWDEVEHAMVRGTRAVAEACIEHGVERLVYVSSTAALYLGRSAGEVVDDDVDVDPHPRTRAVYARGKIAAEREIQRLIRERGLKATIVRPAIVVGRGTPLQHSGLGLWVRDNHCVGWGLGRRPVPLVLVEDVAAALVRLATFAGDSLDGQALNLAARAALSPREVVAAYRRGTGRDFHFHPRPIAVSWMLELGKWVVKRVGGRRDAAFPSWHDFTCRQMWPRLTCERARDILGWRPCDDDTELLWRVFDPPDAT